MPVYVHNRGQKRAHSHTRERTKMNGATGGLALNPLRPISTSFLSASRPRKFPTCFPRKLSERARRPKGILRTIFQTENLTGEWDKQGRWKSGRGPSFLSWKSMGTMGRSMVREIFIAFDVCDFNPGSGKRAVLMCYAYLCRFIFVILRVF